MSLSIIVAVARNGVIGRDGALPWHISADLKRFKQLTMDHAIIMGRRTWESLGRPLPGRRSIVVSRNSDYRAEGVEVVGSLDEALRLSEGDAESFVIGGASLYEEALSRAQRLYLTRVNAEVPGDTFFPPVDWSQWRLADETPPTLEGSPFPYSFALYERE